MAHFITVPINENGVITDEKISSDLANAMASPFNFSDVFIYSHGWWTSASRCMGEYNRFSIEFAKQIRLLAGQAPNLPGHEALGIGIHWPSMLSEDDDSIENYCEALSFYTMEKRADTIGEHGAYAILKLLLNGRTGNNAPLRIHWIGHSFGCRVVCSALEEIIDDGYQVSSNIQLNIVLLQAACDNNDLEQGDVYGRIGSALPTARLLITRSDADKALQDLYAKAHIVDFFRPHGSRIALGAKGPTPAAIAQFGGAGTLDVDSGFGVQAIAQMQNRMIVANLSPLHAASTEPVDNFSGRHSDIYHPEIYNLIAGFLFG